MSTLAIARDWTPKLSPDGEHYCSPACGGGTFCKKSWFDQAESEANALAERMGAGWEPCVWENLGWHYSVRRGNATIHPRRTQGGPVLSYAAWIEPGISIHQHTVQFIQSADTPDDALGFATQEARTFMSRLSDTLSDLADSGPST